LEMHKPHSVGYFTHSMGGVVLRNALSHPEFPESAKSGRAVLLGPPMRGSSFARMVFSLYDIGI
jgi:alpha-beta hydrolase superfamily lysophospholipase